MSVLVDTSVWVDYFRGNENADKLNILIQENLLVSNALILTELIPFLKRQREYNLIALLRSIETTKMHIEWEEIIHLQTQCLKKGINSVGIPDLLIVQNVLQHGITLFSHDKHFSLMSKIFHFKVWA